MKALFLAACICAMPIAAAADDQFLVSPDGTYLGKLNDNQYDSDSVSNPYGKYGSEYSSDSINNPYGEYGSKYSNKSARNPYATDAPIVVDPDSGSTRRLTPCIICD